MKIVTQKTGMSALVITLVISLSGGAHAQARGSMGKGENGALVHGVSGAGTTMPGAATGSGELRSSAGLTKGTDGIISSMRSNGTRTTESSNLRAPNRTGTVPGLP
jgi:hypothetical protein